MELMLAGQYPEPLQGRGGAQALDGGQTCALHLGYALSIPGSSPGMLLVTMMRTGRRSWLEGGGSWEQEQGCHGSTGG